MYFGLIPKKTRKCDWLGFESGSKNVSSLLRVELGKCGEGKDGAFGERSKGQWFHAIIRCGLEIEVWDEDGHDILRAYRVWGSFRSVIKS